MISRHLHRLSLKLHNVCIENGVVVFEAHVAQVAEHVLGKDEVTGSSPVVGSRLRPWLRLGRQGFGLLVN